MSIDAKTFELQFFILERLEYGYLKLCKSGHGTLIDHFEWCLISAPKSTSQVARMLNFRVSVELLIFHLTSMENNFDFHLKSQSSHINSVRLDLIIVLCHIAGHRSINAVRITSQFAVHRYVCAHWASLGYTIKMLTKRDTNYNAITNTHCKQAIHSGVSVAIVGGPLTLYSIGIFNALPFTRCLHIRTSNFTIKQLPNQIKCVFYL